MEYTVNQLYQHLFEKPLNIYDVFKNFFGEDFVDMQSENSFSIKEFLFAKICDKASITKGNTEEDFNLSFDVSAEQLSELETEFIDNKFIIYVWWPHVTITNEYDKSVDIQDLYAKIEIQNDGRIAYEYCGFELNRATYTKEQFINGYLHSHIRTIPKSDFTTFMEPCLGSGPIKNTILTLKNTYDETTWMLFCQELSLYVTVESIAGGPWMRLENIRSIDLHPEYSDYNLERNYTGSKFPAIFTNEDFKNFIQYYLKYGHLSIRYVQDKFTYGMSYYEYIIDISNAFIDYYNNYLGSTAQKLGDCFTRGLLKNVFIANGKFYKIDANSSTTCIDDYQNKLVLIFKGKDILTKIIDTNYDNSEALPTTVINHNVAMYILKRILRTINFRYKNEHNNKYRRNQEATPACERVIYL